MTNERIRSFCELFYASHYLPISFYDNKGMLVHAFSSLENALDIFQSVFAELKQNEMNPGIIASSFIGTYGKIKINSTSETIVVGPVFNCYITADIVRKFMSENTFPLSMENEIAQFLGGLPQYTYNKFLNLLAYLHYELNNEKISIVEHFNIAYSTEDINKEIASFYTKLVNQDKDELYEHGTYHFENQMLNYVQRGETEKLKAFLISSLKITHLEEGRLADNPLRQAKNLFIGLVGMVGKDGAIKGGLDIEQTYHLIDKYTRECEKMQSVSAIKNLQFNMIMDFTERVAQAKVPAGLSKEIYSCIQYIKSHTNESIGIDSVANHINKSRAYITKKFRNEIGTTIASFITQCRLDEAKSMLVYTEKSLVEISYYLCFSSQSYFQNTFKKKYGITPAKYRKQNTITIMN